VNIIRILAITPFPPIINGGSIASYNILKRLSKKHTIIVLTYSKTQQTSRNLFVRGANLKEKTSFTRGIFFILFSLIWGIIYSIKFRPDVIYAKNLVSPGISATILSTIFRIPVVLHSSGPDVEDPLITLYEMGFMAVVVSQVMLRFLKFQIMNATAIIANCYEDVLAIKKIDSTRSSILIYNGVDTKKFCPVSSSQKRILRESIGIDPDKLTIITVAKFRMEKRLDRILSLSKDFSAQFIIIGVTRKDLGSLGTIPPSCKPLGIISNVDMFLKASDIFLLTSDGEGLSNAMLEAFSVGIPVISTSVGEARHILQQNSIGYIANTHKERMNRLMYLHQNPKQRKEIGKMAREYVLNNHEWNRTTKSVEKVFKKSIS